MSSLKDQAARIIGRSERITATFEEIADRDRQLEATLAASNASIAALQGETHQLREQIARCPATWLDRLIHSSVWPEWTPHPP